MHNEQRRDESELMAFVRNLEGNGVQLVTAGNPVSLAATALLGKALKRAGIAVCGLTVASSAARVDDEEARPAMERAEALLVIGTRLGNQRLSPTIPQLIIDATDDEPLVERALRLAESLTHANDLNWVAALGLVRDGRSHPILERALARHTREDLLRVTDLLDAAVRSPMPGMMSVIALELLIATPDPRRFLSSEPCDLLRRCQAIVTMELAKATRIRPRAGYGVVVVEYDSSCHLEDLVAERWRGLRPGTAILIANHGWVENRVAVVARSAAPEALERLRSTIGENDSALLTRSKWFELLSRLGVSPVELEPQQRHSLDIDGALAANQNLALAN